MTEGPHYIVTEGTNLRICSKGWNIGIPTVYDTLEIAQHTIDDENLGRRDIDKLLVRKPSRGRTLVPMSIVEYNRKYPKLMGTKED